jgi:RNA polymerase sigma-70 factor (ECF subfamily)
MKENSIQTIALQYIETKADKDFGILMDRLRPGLTSFVYKFVKDVDLSKEIVLQVFINIWEKSHQYNDQYMFSTWAYGIARNEALCALRLQKRNVSREKLEENNSRVLKLYSPVVNIEMEVVGPPAAEIIDILHEKTIDEIYKLEEPYKSVMVEREINSKQLQDISNDLGWNLSTVKTRLRKARKDIAINITKNHPGLVDAYNELEK